jgi:hypothetical protein
VPGILDQRSWISRQDELAKRGKRRPPQRPRRLPPAVFVSTSGYGTSRARASAGTRGGTGAPCLPPSRYRRYPSSPLRYRRYTLTRRRQYWPGGFPAVTGTAERQARPSPPSLSPPPPAYFLLPDPCRRSCSPPPVPRPPLRRYRGRPSAGTAAALAPPHRYRRRPSAGTAAALAPPHRYLGHREGAQGGNQISCQIKFRQRGKCGKRVQRGQPVVV